MANAYELEDDFIITEDEFVAMLVDAHAAGSGPIGDALKWLFIGTPEYGPCQGTYRMAWLHHWLIGNHSYIAICCTCPYPGY